VQSNPKNPKKDCKEGLFAGVVFSEVLDDGKI
jgi:hypothetical protein